MNNSKSDGPIHFSGSTDMKDVEQLAQAKAFFKDKLQVTQNVQLNQQKINNKAFNSLTFPSFDDLPTIYEPSMCYYKFDRNIGAYVLFRNWCFIGEVINDQFHPFRPGVLTKTRFSEKPVPVVYYLDNNDVIKKTSLEKMKPGTTLCVLNAESKTFMDGSTGIRQESIEYSHNFKIGMQSFFEEASKLLNAADGYPTCFNCNMTGSEEHQLRSCSRCHLAQYCSRDCQTNHWTLHKKCCDDSDLMLRLAALYRLRYTEYSFQSLPPVNRKIRKPLKIASEISESVTPAVVEELSDSNEEEKQEEDFLLKYKDEFDDDGVPHAFKCPISLGIFEDPVLCSDGQTYERKYIEDWLKNHTQSPWTRENLVDKTLTSQFQLKDEIKIFLERQSSKTSSLSVSSTSNATSSQEGKKKKNKNKIKNN